MNEWHEAEERVERAYQLSESRRWAEALAEIDAAVAINPHNGTWIAQRGFLLDQLERFEDAIEAYRASLELEPGDIEVMLALGLDLARAGHSVEAVEVFEELIRLAPDMEQAYCYSILAYADLNKHDKAEEMFYLAQQLVEDCPHCFYHIGGSLMARGKYEKSIYCWMRTLDIEPAFPGVKRCIAQAYRELGNIDRAREYFLADLREDPGDIELLYDMAELELEAGKPTKAATKLRQIAELDPEDAQAHFMLGEVLLEIDSPKEAIDSFRVASKHDPGLPRLNLRMGQALLLSSELNPAQSALAQAVKEDPEDHAALMAWGNCLLRLSKTTDAARAFKRALALDERSADVHHNLGICYFVQGEYALGLEHELRAVDLDSGHSAAMRKAIVALMHLRRWNEVRTLVDRALELEPEDSALRSLRSNLWRYRLGAAFASLGRATKSILSKFRK